MLPHKKVVVHFKNTGPAPILKSNRFKLPADANFLTVTRHLRSLLCLSASEPLFLYCQCAFAPSPNEMLSDVADCFADKNGVLLVNYATIPAWG